MPGLQNIPSSRILFVSYPILKIKTYKYMITFVDLCV
jgi:hypothetical protein